MSEISSLASAELTSVETDPTAVRRAFAHFPSGVAALSGVVDGELVVLVASSFQVGISADPPLVLFAVQHTSTSWPKLRSCRRIGVSVLRDSDDAVARQLSSKLGDRFAGIDCRTTGSGANFITGSAILLECSVHSEVPAGDHNVVLLEVHAVHAESETEPLVWHASTFRSLATRAIPDQDPR